MIRHRSHRSIRTIQAHRRRGSLYVSVIMVGAVVSVLGLSALLVGRITGRSQAGLADTTAARMNAQAAIRLGLLAIEQDANWRFSYDSETWFDHLELGDGTYSLTVTDPSDGDIADAPADPVILRGTGRSGHAVHQAEITLAPLYRGYDCLQSALHAGDDIRFASSVATISHTASANDDISATSSTVDADLVAGDNISGWYFLGDRTEDADPKTVPPADDVLEYYREHGTWINVSDIPRQFADVIHNGGFERTTDFWKAVDCAHAVDNGASWTGKGSVLVTDRTSEHAGIFQDVTHLLQSGRTYNIDLALSSSVAATFYVHIRIEDAAGLNEYVANPITTDGDNRWRSTAVEIRPWFDSPLTSAQILINTSPDAYEMVVAEKSATPIEFWLDEVSMRESGSDYALDQVLLSPHHNPFGDLDPKGIYVLDLKGRRIVIRNSRIHGTLVLLDPASSTELGDGAGLLMSAAEPGFPSLLVSGNSFTVNPSDKALSESAMQLNLNPSGAPHGAGVDDDMTDTFASGIQGLMFTSHRVTLSNVTMTGAIVSENDICLDGDFSLTFDNQYFRNPPPGFNGPEQIRVLLGSARRISE